MTRNYSPERRRHIQSHVLIAGAGAAGQMAAFSLRRQGIDHVLIEGRNRPDGRIKTNTKGSHPIEEGAEFLHGTHTITHRLAAFFKKRLIPFTLPERQHLDDHFADSSDNIPTGAALLSILKEAALQEDIDPVNTSVSELIDRLDSDIVRNRRFCKRILANDIAGDISTLSVAGLLDNSCSGFGNNYRFADGYGSLLKSLRGNSPLFLNHPIEKISHDAAGVTIDTQRATFHGRYAIITLPLGVLQSRMIKFRPVLSDSKQRAIDAIAPGEACKMIFQMDDVLDTRLQAMIETTLDSQLWWPSQWGLTTKDRCITALVAGNAARRYAHMSDEEATHEALTQLGSMIDKRLVPRVVESRIVQWHEENFTRGSYSYIPVGVDPSVRTDLARSEGALYFAGEAVSSQPGTVHGALESGLHAARAVRKRSMQHVLHI